MVNGSAWEIREPIPNPNLAFYIRLRAKGKARIQRISLQDMV